MNLIQELIESSRVSSKAAASVYHRDYERTKNKSYRKYDPKKRHTEEEEVSDEPDTTNTEVVDEGALDFVRGAAGHVGNRISQAAGNVVRAGQTASVMGDLTTKINQLAQSLSTYDKLKGTQPPPQAKRSAPQPQQNTDQQLPVKKPSDAVPAPFRMAHKPRMRNGEFVFSAYLQQYCGDMLDEGVWDFLKGAVGGAGQAVSQAVGGAVQAGKFASNTADYQKTVGNIKQLVSEIAGLLGRLNNPTAALEQIFDKSTLNPLVQQRIQRLVSAKLQK